MYQTRRFVLYPVLGLLGACAQALAVVPACNSSIYCFGDLLHKVQMARIFPDSKTFVDMKVIHSPNQTLEDFEKFMEDTNSTPSRKQIELFVDGHFEPGDELEAWSPPDFNPSPPVLNNIVNPKLKQFAKDVIAIWPSLGRKVKLDVSQRPDHYSLIPVPNGFIVPGGRFKELYYWDSFWIVRGLLISNMTDTAKGMVENLLHLVRKYGYIPNGSRIYYLGRSQPPLLTAMVGSIFWVTRDLSWLKRHMTTVEKELQYWLDQKTMSVVLNGTKYMLLRYISATQFHGPRPESYNEDYTNSRVLPTDELRQDFYEETKSAAESGWDFSSRWIIAPVAKPLGNVTDIHTTRILPVDLNAIFANALQLAGEFRSLLKDRREAQKWWGLAKYWRTSIEKVLYDSKDGTWYDYDCATKEHRKHFYPSCATPLWAGAVEPAKAEQYGARLVQYLNSSGGINFPGGVPASIYHTGEQWDFPNAWPPLQSILIGGLEMSGNEEAKLLAKTQASLWIHSNYLGFSNFKKMFEKYSAMQPGHTGGGGEYEAQAGFGWTNGVVLELLARHGDSFSEDVPSPSVFQF